MAFRTGAQTADVYGNTKKDGSGTDYQLLVDESGRLQIDTISGLEIPAHDYVSLSYTGDNLTGVVYKTGGAGGTTVATLTLEYTGAVLDTVTKT